MEVIKIGKGDIKLPLIADDMLMYIENPMESTKKYWNYHVNLTRPQDESKQYFYNLAMNTGK